MKTLFSAFPLFKKKRFYVFLALILIFCALTGFLYTKEETKRPLSFEDEKEAIEAALDAAEQSLATCEEDDKGRFLQEKAYYESALQFELSPWGSDFAYEGLSLYAALSLKEGTGQTLEKLADILRRRDANGLYELCKEDPDLPDPDLRLLSTENASSPGSRALLHEIFLLEESLETGKDLYFAKETVLKEGEKALFERLLKYKEALLLDGSCNPVPLNRLTLLSTERMIACLLTVLFLAAAGYGEREAEGKAVFLFPLVLTGAVLLCAVSLFFTTLLSAPGTVQREALQWGGTLPFFPALFFRLLCRVLGSLPLMLFCLFLRLEKGKTKAWKLLAFLPLFRLILAVPLSTWGPSSVGSLSLCILPNLDANVVKNPFPWLGIVLWLTALVLSAWLLWKKQKITLKKQEVSLEKKQEL